MRILSLSILALTAHLFFFPIDVLADGTARSRCASASDPDKCIKRDQDIEQKKLDFQIFGTLQAKCEETKRIARESLSKLNSSCKSLKLGKVLECRKKLNECADKQISGSLISIVPNLPQAIEAAKKSDSKAYSLLTNSTLNTCPSAKVSGVKKEQEYLEVLGKRISNNKSKREKINAEILTLTSELQQVEAQEKTIDENLKNILDNKADTLRASDAEIDAKHKLLVDAVTEEEIKLIEAQDQLAVAVEEKAVQEAEETTRCENQGLQEYREYVERIRKLRSDRIKSGKYNVSGLGKFNVFSARDKSCKTQDLWASCHKRNRRNKINLCKDRALAKANSKRIQNTYDRAKRAAESAIKRAKTSLRRARAAESRAADNLDFAKKQERQKYTQLVNKATADKKAIKDRLGIIRGRLLSLTAGGQFSETTNAFLGPLLAAKGIAFGQTESLGQIQSKITRDKTIKSALLSKVQGDSRALAQHNKNITLSDDAILSAEQAIIASDLNFNTLKETCCPGSRSSSDQKKIGCIDNYKSNNQKEVIEAIGGTAQ